MRLVALLLLMVLILGIFFYTSLSPSDRRVLFRRANTFDYNDAARTYRLHLPSKQPSKLLIALHGYGGSGRQMAYLTGLHNTTDDQTVVLYPDAVGRPSGWNAGFCCGGGWTKGIDDVGFIEALIKSYQREYSINPTSTFITGFSNGGMLAHRIAAEKPELIGGAAVVAGTVGANNQRIKPIKPVPLLILHGEKDRRVSFAGGASPGDPGFVWDSFEHSLATWQSVNQTNTPILSHSYPNSGHSWPDWRTHNSWRHHPEGSKRVVDFFASLSHQ